MSVVMMMVVADECGDNDSGGDGDDDDDYRIMQQRGRPQSVNSLSISTTCNPCFFLNILRSEPPLSDNPITQNKTPYIVLYNSIVTYSLRLV